MKSVKLTKPYRFNHARGTIAYKTVGETYHSVPEDHAKAIVAAGCGEIVATEKEPAPKSRIVKSRADKTDDKSA